MREQLKIQSKTHNNQPKQQTSGGQLSILSKKYFFPSEIQF